MTNLEEAYKVINEGWQLLKNHADNRPAFFSVVADLDKWQKKYKNNPGLFDLASNMGIGIYAYLDKNSRKKGSV
jgi:hypothetical protein